MKLNADIKEIPRKVWISLAVVIAISGAAYAGWNFSKHPPSHPVTPAENKTAVRKHLQQRTERTEFKPLMDLTKEKIPWNAMKGVYDNPPDYKTVYRNIGDQLATAEYLINQSEERQQLHGIRIVAELCNVAIEVAVDPWLAARMCDAYLIPNLDKVGDKPKFGPSNEQYMHIAGRIYREAEENDRLIELGKAYLAKAEPGQKADHIRWRLARALEQKGDYKEALKYLHEITHPSLTNEVNRRVVIAERNLKSAKN